MRRQFYKYISAYKAKHTFIFHIQFEDADTDMETISGTKAFHVSSDLKRENQETGNCSLKTYLSSTTHCDPIVNGSMAFVHNIQKKSFNNKYWVDAFEM